MLGVAAVFGSLSILAANMWLKSAAEAQAPDPVPVAAIPEGPKVEFGTIVVAREPLRYGMPVTADVLSEIPWPKESLPQGSFAKIADLTGEAGRIVLSAVEPNEPVLLAKLSGPDGRASLSNRLTPGMQAVTIRTDEVAGVGGFITPGDRVDVVLTRSAGEQANTAQDAAGKAIPGANMVSETIISGVKVLTVGQGADERETSPRLANSVTLEVTPSDARKIALARNIGQLSLSLLSTAAADNAGDTATLSSLTTLATKAADAATALPVLPDGAPKEQPLVEVKVTRGLVGEFYKVPAKSGPVAE
ncbi:MAG: Flp pilus assembly protein CpaB [Notoacmeibacter sp.]|nr:Flp pilus assembly protein CpaB [Notoacmeibacter sp.]